MTPEGLLLREEVDTLIVIPNDRLLSISDRNVSVLDAFRSADQVLTAAGEVRLVILDAETGRVR